MISNDLVVWSVVWLSYRHFYYRSWLGALRFIIFLN
jgi:hypothetical protein